MLHLVKKVDRLVHQYLLLGFLLILLIVLRVPNFFEPYWYGDEGIYLTLGTAMRHGERLYADIIDHKTPVIYYLAMIPSQREFRVLNVATSIITVSLFYFLAQKLFKSKIAVFLASLIFVLLTALPWFEGHIPNGELFVMFFVFMGATFLSKTAVFRRFLQPELPAPARKPVYLFLAGIFFGLGILTKVPALFDVLAFLFIFWLMFVDNLLARSKSIWQNFVNLISQGGIVMVGIAVPIVISVIYFIARGSGQAYLDYGLLYNFRYVESWVPTFAIPLLGKLFTFPAKTAILAIFLILLSFGRKFFSRRFRFIAGWFCLALFASLLSNRPYPHYYLQIIPAFALLMGFLGETFLTQWQTKAKWQVQKMTEILSSIFLAILFFGVLIVLHVGLYSNSEYYGRFFQLVTGKISAIEYRNSFNSLNADNYAAAAIIRTSAQPRMFVWGTNPMLYALSGKSPTGRFTVAFHIYDFDALDETFADVQKFAPEYITVMKQEKPFPALQSYLGQSYTPNMQFEHFTLWKRE